MLNDKAIKPDLFEDDNNEDINLKNNNQNKEINKVENNINNNDKIEQNKLEENIYPQNEMDLPDSSIESEINNYDVRIIYYIYYII